MTKYQCKILGYSKEIKKVCIYIKVKCTNYNRNYFDNFLQCTLQYKAKKAAKKNNVKNKIEKGDNKNER